MTKLEEIKARFLSARKARNEGETALLSVLIGAIETKSKSFNPTRELTDEEVVAVVKSQLKRVSETLQIVGERGSKEQYSVVAGEFIVLKSLLPSQMTVDEIRDFAKRAVANGATSVGEIMKSFKMEKTGLYDGKVASQAANDALK